MQLVLASNNAGKLREFARLLEPLGIEVVPQAKLGIAEADEPHMTFVENALAKARHASAQTMRVRARCVRSDVRICAPRKGA